MKHIAQLCGNLLEQIRIDPERVVEGIVTRSGLKLLDKPTQAKDLVCPSCGSKKGWWNPPWNAWSCAEDNCLQNHSYLIEPEWLKPKKSERIQKTEQPLSLAKYGVPELFSGCTFKDCQLPKDKIQVLLDFSKKPYSFVLLTGQAGRGKTYASCATIRAYVENKGHSVRFENLSDLYLLWKDCARNYGDDLDLAEKYINCELLVLDDLGVRTPTDAYLDFLYTILNRRMNLKLGTIITTNLNSGQMLERMGEALSSRICSGQIIKIEGKDKRLMKEF